MQNIVTFPGLGWEITLNPIALQIGSLKIYWYGIIIAIGFALALAYALSHAKKFGLDPDRVIDVVFVSVLVGIVGARLYYVVFALDEFRNDWTKIFRIWEGGLAIYGGLIFGFITALFMAKWRKVKVPPLFDLAAGSLLLAQGIGRWGNFVNIEAFGGNTTLPWGMSGPRITQYLTAHADELAAAGMEVDPSLPVHPCFLYESLWCLLGFVLLYWYTKRRKFDGEIFLMYIGWYGLGRFFIEGLRTDSLMTGLLRVSQLVAAICVVISVISILVIRSKIRRAGDPEYRMLYVNTEESKEILLEAEEKIEKEKEKKQNRKNKKKPASEPEPEKAAEETMQEQNQQESPSSHEGEAPSAENEEKEKRE